jgi:DNA-binding transcriptional MerR regulator
MMEEQKNKLFYAIGEVAKLYNVSESTLRTWEKQFTKLKPKRSAKGVRLYTKQDLEVVASIVKSRENHTITGTKKKLSGNFEVQNAEYEQIIKLKEIKAFFQEMLKSL